eukprot:Lankesteria_metandrocarpae@DN4346_c0_g1_i5.p1
MFSSALENDSFVKTTVVTTHVHPDSAATPIISNPANTFTQQSGSSSSIHLPLQDTFAVLGKPEKQHLGLPYDENYFNCMDWFAAQTLVDVRLKSAAPFAASLHPEARSEGEVHLEEGERLTLPLAAVTLLAEHGLVEVCVPPCFAEENLQNLKENPRLVNLRRLEPYFFEVGLTLARLTQDAAAFGLLMSTAKTRSSLLTKIVILTNAVARVHTYVYHELRVAYLWTIVLTGFVHDESSPQWCVLSVYRRIGCRP